mgnify:FL=1
MRKRASFGYWDTRIEVQEEELKRHKSNVYSSFTKRLFHFALVHPLGVKFSSQLSYVPISLVHHLAFSASANVFIGVMDTPSADSNKARMMGLRATRYKLGARS